MTREERKAQRKARKLNQRIIESEAKLTQRTSHILHLLLSIITGGVWIPVWMIVAASNAHQRYHAVRFLAKVQTQ